MTETQKILTLLEKASPRERELTRIFLEKLIYNRPTHKNPKTTTAANGEETA